MMRDEISEFASYWSMVTCADCLKHEPLGEVTK